MTPVASFDFGTANRVLFGAGRSAELPALVRSLGARALICTGSRPDRYRELLAALSMSAEVFTVTGEPTVQTARLGVEAGRMQRADVVVAIGGGSVLDLGKAVAMLLGNGGDPVDYLEVIGGGQPITAPSVPFIAVPTTAGTGAEVTANAVLAAPEHGRKVSLRSESMIPTVALIDPLLTLGCPPGVTAASGLDALTQCLEPYVCRQASPLTDLLAAEGLRRCSGALRVAYLDGSDVTARSDLALAAVLGGMSLANAKLGAVHGFAGVIGGLVNAAHGAICAALLAAAVEVTVAALRERDPTSPALDRYRSAAALLTGRPAATIEDGIGWIRDTVGMLGIGGLAALGVRSEMVDDIVDKTRTASSTRGNPIVLTDHELRRALDQSIG